MDIHQGTLSHIRQCSVSLQTIAENNEVGYCSGVVIGDNIVLTAQHGLTNDVRGIAVDYNKGNEDCLFAKKCITSNPEDDLALLIFDRKISPQFVECSGTSLKDRDLIILNSFLRLNPETSLYEPGYKVDKGELKGGYCYLGDGVEVDCLQSYNVAASSNSFASTAPRKLLPLHLPVRPSDSGSGIFNVKGELVSIVAGGRFPEKGAIMSCSDDELIADPNYVGWGIPLEVVRKFLHLNM